MNIEKITELFEKNIERVENTLYLYSFLDNNSENLSKKLSHGKEDLLRFCVVMMHSTLEDFLRNLLKIYIPNNLENGNIDGFKFHTHEKVEKIKLKDLIKHKGKSISEFINENIILSLGEKSFNDSSSIRYALQILKYNIDEHTNNIIIELGNIAQRRHKIVHEADYDFVENGNEKYEIIEIQQVDFWLKIVKTFGNSILSNINLGGYEIVEKSEIRKWKGIAVFEIFTDKSGEYRFRLKAGNGENILASEGYASKDGCENGVQSVRENSQNLKRFEKNKISNGYTFILKAGNGQVLGASGVYVNSESLENGIQSVMKNAPEAEVVELD